jgi:hypothetical protein
MEQTAKMGKFLLNWGAENQNPYCLAHASGIVH